MMAKLVSLLIVGLLGMGQVATQATPQLQVLLDLNGDETVNVADTVLLAGTVLGDQVRRGWVWFLWVEERERVPVCVCVCIIAIEIG